MLTWWLPGCIGKRNIDLGNPAIYTIHGSITVTLITQEMSHSRDECPPKELV